MQARHLELSLRRDQLGENPYFTNDLYFDYEDAFITAKAELTRRTAALRPAAPLPLRATALATSHEQNYLPKLSLPKFSGQQIDWETFKAKFCSMVKDMLTLPNVTKLQHLLSCLEGEAARRLSNLKVTNENFIEAWDILVKRYDNPRVGQPVHINKLLCITPATSKSAAVINRLLDRFSSAMRAMKIMDRPVDGWDTGLSSSWLQGWIIEKSLEGEDNFPKYEQLSTFLQNRARSLEVAHRANPSK